MKIYYPSGDLLTDLRVTDNSFRYRTIAGENSLTLYFSLPEHIEIPIGAWTEFEGERFELLLPENFKKKSTEEFEYTLVMEAAQGRLRKYKFKDTNTSRLKFSFTARPQEHLKMLVDNLNMREAQNVEGTVWMVGNCIEAFEQVISYNHTSCWDALQQIAQAFNTEWEIVVNEEEKLIHLGKVEYNKQHPLPLAYGKGNGFKPGLGRSNFDNSHPIEVLFVQGGDKNIDPSKYGAPELLLPKNKDIGFDGTYFDHETGFDEEEARWYRSDDNGFSLQRLKVELKTYAEDSLDCSHIYPRIGGTVGTVEVIDKEKHFYNFTPDSSSVSVDYNSYRIGNEPMTVIFQQGMLAGKEFEVNYKHSNRCFELIPQDIDGRSMPDSMYRPQKGEEFLIFGIMMPDSIADDNKRIGASWDMFREAVRYFYEHEDPHYSFTGELDGIWAKKDWLNIGGNILPGGYVLFSDDQFQPEGVKIRITGVKDFVNNPHSPVIEISNVAAAGSVGGALKKIDQNEVVTDNQYRDGLGFTKRRFRDAVETMEMLEKALLDNFTESITPITVKTMSMLVGDESLQFRFVTNKTNPKEETDTERVIYENGQLKVVVPSIIQHMTLGIKDISSEHKIEDYRFWDLGPFTSAPLEEKTSYYLYARVSRTGTTGYWYISPEAIPLEDETDESVYNLLAGILNSAYDGVRNYVPLNGYTEILPGRITTNRIVSADGDNYVDFQNNAARIGNSNTYLDFNSKGDGKLKIKGSIFQSESGEESFPGVFRGTYRSGSRYYPGDEVTHTVNGITSTYRYINLTAAEAPVPPNSGYWQLVASGGSNGKDGDYFEYRYAKGGSKTDPPKPIPSGTTGNPTGWTTLVPTAGLLEYVWCSIAKKTAAGVVTQEWSYPVRVSGADGEKGDKGEPGSSPALVFRGKYSPTEIYYGTTYRVDCVEYKEVYYVAAINAGEISGITPGPLGKWNEFGSQFESIATKLLLTENANIASFVFKNERMESQTSSNSTPNIILDGKNNEASFAAGKVTFTKDEAKIGSFEIKDGDIVGYDDGGIKRIQISRKKTPGIEDITDGSIDQLSKSTFGGYTVLEQYRENVQGFNDDDFDYNSNIINDNVTYFNRQFSLGTTYWFDRTGPGYIVFKCPFKIKEAGYITANVNNYISSSKEIIMKNAKAANSIEIYKESGARVTNVGQARTLLDPGDYYFRITLTYTTSPALDGPEYYITTVMQLTSVDFERLFTSNIIGSDGIVSRWGAKKYLSFRNEVGFEVRFGEYGLRITENGLKKLVNSSWVDI